jgi:hypothetical protein
MPTIRQNVGPVGKQLVTTRRKWPQSHQIFLVLGFKAGLWNLQGWCSTLETYSQPFSLAYLFILVVQGFELGLTLAREALHQTCFSYFSTAVLLFTLSA